MRIRWPLLEVPLFVILAEPVLQQSPLSVWEELHKKKQSMEWHSLGVVWPSALAVVDSPRMVPLLALLCPPSHLHCPQEGQK